MRHGTARSGGTDSASSVRRRTVLSLVAALLGACGGAELGSEVPVAAIASSPRSGADLSALLRDWSTGTASSRLALEPRLAAYEKRHPEDGALSLVRVLRAHNALERGETARTTELASPVALGPPGTARDLALLALGAVERRNGKPERALAALEPLSDKLIDPWASSLLGEELTRAALAAHRWERAVRYMDRWLRQSERGGRAAVLGRIERLVAEVDPGELLRAFDGLRTNDEAMLDEEVSALVVSRLAAVATEQRDPGLARSLLEQFRPLLGTQGESIARLAASTGRATVAIGTLGLVLELGSAELRDRSADVTAGVTFGLGLPGSTARLVTRAADGSPEGLAEALAGLAADGAAVVIAGIDPGRVPAAIELAGDSDLPLLLLSHPATFDPSRAPTTFLVGGDPAAGVAELLAGLQQAGRRHVAVVGPGERSELSGVADDAVVATLPCGPELDVGRLRGLAVDAVVVSSGARCGRQAASAARELRAVMGVGLGVAGLTARELDASWHLSTGLFPVRSEPPPPALAEWLASRAEPPSWWAALGRDAAVLGWAAVRTLPELERDDPAEVAALRAAAASALVRARASLWTSSEGGFDGRRVLSRPLTLIGPREEPRRGR